MIIVHDMDELFDKRGTVGARLEIILRDKGITKYSFCSDVGISRPTLNKLLSGEVTNKATFTNHMNKILHHLDTTPAGIMENIKNPYIKLRSMLKALRKNADDIFKATAIAPERLIVIESGSEAKMSELRDIALALNTGVKSILGENTFSPSISMLSYFLEESEAGGFSEASGFWGHVGIRPSNATEYHWYPINSVTRNKILRTANKDFLVVPCMNNLLLLVNTRKTGNIILLDEACDEPANTNWDPSISCGEIPPVIYESLDDYLMQMDSEGIQPEDFSPMFLDSIKSIIESQKWDEDRIYEITSSINVIQNDGKTFRSSIDCNGSNSLLDEVETLYNFDGELIEGGLQFYTDFNGAQVFVNIDLISIVELPLAQVEMALYSANEESLSKYEE